MHKLKLSVIILNYKVPYHLLLCLQSVRKSLRGISSEIIVVDNNSEDESCELIRAHFPEVVLISNSKNEGFSKGNNRGVKIAKGENICLLNPDTVVSEKVFKHILKFSENHPDFGAIGVKMIDGTGNFLPESKRNLPMPKIAFQKLLGNAKKYYADHLKENETGKIEILPGAFMFMKKSRYLEVGGLDEDYFMYGEDIDLSYKFLKANYQNYYVGSETILHFKGESTVKNREYAKRFYGAMQLFYQKHFKSNFAMDLAVKTGVNLGRARTIFQQQKKPVFPQKQRNYLMSENNSKLHLKLLATCNMEMVSPQSFLNREISNSRIIFDAESIAFAEIFSVMQACKNPSNRFRIFPGIGISGQNFLLGSDNSAEKGEVWFF